VVAIVKNIHEHEFTCDSHEKYPFLIEIAGSSGSIGGFGRSNLSSANRRSSSRFNDTLQLTTC
jgi:hypothetical protein